MNGSILKVTGAEWRGMVDVARMPNGRKEFTSGSAVEILHDLQYILNFTLESIVVNDYFPMKSAVTGGFENNDSIAYQLQEGKADIAVGLLYYVLPRIQYASIMVPLSQEPFQAYFTQPTNIIGQNNVYEKPLTPKLLLSFLLILTAIHALIEVSNNKSKQRVAGFRSTKCEIVFRSVAWALGAFCQQEYNWKPAKIQFSHMLLLCGGLITSSSLYIYYAASILSYFTADVKIIQNFSQLLDNSFTIYTVDSVTSTLLSATQKSLYQFSPVGQNASILKVFQPGHAHLDTDDIFYPDAEQLGISKAMACTLSRVRIFKGGGLTAGYYCRKGFPYRKAFNIGLLKICEAGLTGRYTGKYLKNTVAQCPQIKIKYHDHLGLDEVSFLYFVYLTCCACVVLIFVIEKGWKTGFQDDKVIKLVA